MGMCWLDDMEGNCPSSSSCLSKAWGTEVPYAPVGGAVHKLERHHVAGSYSPSSSHQAEIHDEDSLLLEVDTFDLVCSGRAS